MSHLQQSVLAILYIFSTKYDGKVFMKIFIKSLVGKVIQIRMPNIHGCQSSQIKTTTSVILLLAKSIMSYLCLKTVEIGYNFPSKWINSFIYQVVHESIYREESAYFQ